MRHLALLFACICCATHSLFGVSVKASGMGEAMMAFPQDSLTSIYNPAHASQICSRLDLGVNWKESAKQLSIRNREEFFSAITQEGAFPTKHSGFVFPEIGLNYWLTCDLAVGLAGNNAQNISTRYHTPLTDFSGVNEDGIPLGTRARFEYRVEEITATVAYRLTEGQSIGIGINVYGSRFKIAGLQRMESFSSNPTHFTDKGADRAWGVGFTVGWLGSFWDCLTAGVSYSPRVSMRAFDLYSGLLPNHRIDIPAVVRAGLAYQLLPCFTLALDGEFRNYSQVHAWSNRFVADSQNGFGPLFGTKEGPGFGWRDQWMVKVGGEWAVTSCLSLRAGYRHEQSPIRGNGTRTALNVYTLLAVENSVSVGGTWSVTPCSELSVFGEVGLFRKQHSRYPSNFSDEGEVVNFLAGDLTFKDRNYRGGFSYGIEF